MARGVLDMLATDCVVGVRICVSVWKERELLVSRLVGATCSAKRAQAHPLHKVTVEDRQEGTLALPRVRCHCCEGVVDDQRPYLWTDLWQTQTLKESHIRGHREVLRDWSHDR